MDSDPPVLANHRNMRCEVSSCLPTTTATGSHPFIHWWNPVQESPPRSMASCALGRSLETFRGFGLFLISDVEPRCFVADRANLYDAVSVHTSDDVSFIEFAAGFVFDAGDAIRPSHSAGNGDSDSDDNDSDSANADFVPSSTAKQ
jgi:hypothetical protein